MERPDLYDSVMAMEPRTLTWTAIQSIEPDHFVCGYCGNAVGGDRGWDGVDQYDRKSKDRIYICPVA